MISHSYTFKQKFMYLVVLVIYYKVGHVTPNSHLYNIGPLLVSYGHVEAKGTSGLAVEPGTLVYLLKQRWEMLPL